MGSQGNCISKTFEELSIEEVKKFNGEEKNSDVVEAWRAGYIYAQLYIKKHFEECYQDEFIDNVEKFVYDELDAFEEWD